jgi:release factor glutamine methyltransferase
VTAAADADTALSVAAARRHLAQRFREAGLDTPDLDARVLVGHALELDHAALAAQSDRHLTNSEADAIAALMQRRLDREPVARIVGTKEFWGLPLALNADTLVPRPETETVVEAALAAIGDDRRRALRIADLDTGSGALLLALLSELPAAHGIGTDISTAALECARANAAALGLGSRASFVACDHGAALGCAALAGSARGGFDLVVANPPYIASAEIAGLAPEVREFDPRRALDGGADGLAAYRAIIGDARRLLAPQGVLVLELGAGQLDAVTLLATDAGLTPAAAARRDLAGVPRALAVKVLS